MTPLSDPGTMALVLGSLNVLVLTFWLVSSRPRVVLSRSPRRARSRGARNARPPAAVGSSGERRLAEDLRRWRIRAARETRREDGLDA